MTRDDDRARVTEANTRFYRVFESQDLDQMEALWAHGDHVRCVHPGRCRLAGWKAVRRSWELIFQSGHEMRFSIEDVSVHVDGGLGWVACTENILSEAHGTISVTSILATNIFERAGLDWLMVHHHASHVLAGDGSARS